VPKVNPSTLVRGFVAGLAAAVLAFAPVAFAAPALSPDDQALVDQASRYLEDFTALKGRFVQTDANGAVSEGAFYLQRPGRARFAYDPPSNELIVSDGRTVTVINPRLRTHNSYPLGQTPLALFLSKHVSLDHGVEVTHVEPLDDGFSLTARDAHHPKAGTVTLTFRGNPLRLEAWAETDAEGGATRVKLTSIEPADALDPSLFTVPDGSQSGSVPPPPN
jgi:outer membrane lipoprotein-sorting protein